MSNKAILDFSNSKVQLQIEPGKDIGFDDYEMEEVPSYQQGPQMQGGKLINTSARQPPQAKPEQGAQKRIQQLNECIKDFELDIKQKMEYNWKLMYALEDMIYQRNTLYNILKDIEGICQKFPNSQIKTNLVSILGKTPADFLQ